MSHRRKTRRRLPLLAGVLTGLLGLLTLLGSAIAAIAPGGQPTAAAAPAAPNADCALLVPADPLSATGLATPYRLTATDPAKGPCHEADAAQSAFVQATVLDPATGALSVYNPLVVDRGTRPARTPVRPKLPARAVVALWFGFNGDNLTLRGPLSSGRCVNGTPGSIFGQFAYCNAPAFFAGARAAERTGRLKVPPLGTGRDGAPCPSTRDFGVVDQDQSDNVTSAYLATADGRTAQRTTRNAAALGNHASTILNGSDNLLLTAFVDPPLGCTPWTAPDLADPGQQTTSLALDELQAAADQRAPVALVPLNDPMVLGHSGAASRVKTNLYRVGVGQPLLGHGAGTDPGSAKVYCANLGQVGAARLRTDRQFFTGAVSPQDGQDLLAFLTDRLSASLTNLGCPTPTASPTATQTPTQTPTGMPSTSASASASVGATATVTASATATATATAAATATATVTVTATAGRSTPAGSGTAPAVPASAPTGSPRPTDLAAPAASASVVPALVPPTSVPPTAAPSTAAPAPHESLGTALALAPIADAIPGVQQIGAATTRSSTVEHQDPARGALTAAGAPGRSPWPYAGIVLSLGLLAGSVSLFARRR
ncbi:hypothetical protein [Streptacidiphilus rugosus]|uniref:hypothetical protein n=1 Tax=Streptacidiphilus rugosus TaxID=405783 RepID=UPI0007C73AF7|nr:hypothetical protein [Streptacidiphilus rugosus]